MWVNPVDVAVTKSTVYYYVVFNDIVFAVMIVCTVTWTYYNISKNEAVAGAIVQVDTLCLFWIRYNKVTLSIYMTAPGISYKVVPDDMTRPFRISLNLSSSGIQNIHPTINGCGVRYFQTGMSNLIVLNNVAAKTITP